jgi:hypothetical protein
MRRFPRIDPDAFCPTTSSAVLGLVRRKSAKRATRFFHLLMIFPARPISEADYVSSGVMELVTRSPDSSMNPKNPDS